MSEKTPASLPELPAPPCRSAPLAIRSHAIVRRRWNDPNSAKAPLAALRELVIKNDPGGICGPIPRPFPYARVWCDQLIDGHLIHICDPVTAPHELQLCVLEGDNSAEINAQIRAKLRR
jgi:hypothetical protein